MDYRIIFCVIIGVLTAQSAPTNDNFPTLTRDEISHGPLLLNDEDREALLKATTGHELNKAEPDEEVHGILVGLLKSAETATDVLKRIMSNVQNHEEESHNAIENLRTVAPEATDVCVRDVFGTPTRLNPVYCGVKYFSQVAIGLYDMSQTVIPLKETIQKLVADLAGCKAANNFGNKFICTSQAYRDCWENSEIVRLRLGQHLTIIRSLAIGINDCIKSSHGAQALLVKKVSECTQTRADK